MWYGLLADLVVALHVAYVSFVVLGQLAILVGILARWRWVRNFWFRAAHLLAITIVAAEALLDITCPLTAWEDRLRLLAGQQGNRGDFLGHFLHEMIFFDCPPWVFTAVYVAFALLVLATFAFAPPRPPFPRAAAPNCRS
jgi:hypothetical protein